MALYVYYTSNGALYSWAPDDDAPVASDAQLSAQGMAKKTGLPPLDNTHVWDAPTTTVKTIAAPTPANNQHTFDFIMAFTPQELAAIRASTDPIIAQFLFAMQCTQGVNLTANTITNALTYLVNHSLLTAQRAQTIQATTTSGTAGG